DRIVRKTVKDRSFAAEKVQDLGIASKLGADHLDCDRVSRLDVEPAIDLAHAPLGDQSFNFIDIVEARPGPHAPRGGALKDGSILLHEFPLQIKPPIQSSRRREPRWPVPSLAAPSAGLIANSIFDVR